MTAEDLKNLFSRFGPIARLAIKTGTNGFNSNYGFVHFYRVESAQRAIRELDNLQVCGKVLNFVLIGHKNKKFPHFRRHWNSIE